MGRKVIYKCDLCREEKPHTDMKTIFHTNCIDGKFVPYQFVLTNVQVNDPIDKQICIECIQMIKDA